MSLGIQKPKGRLTRVGTSPLTAFYEGICFDNVENCIKQLERAAGIHHAISLRLYPMSEDIQAFMMVVTVGGMVVGNGLGSLHRLDGSTTKVICEAPRYSPRDVLVGVVILLGIIALALMNNVTPANKCVFLLIAVVVILPFLRRQYRRYTSANEMLEFVKSALHIG
jgi:hypothetical protein